MTILEQLQQLKKQEMKIAEEIEKTEVMKDKMIENEVNDILLEEKDEEDKYAVGSNDYYAECAQLSSEELENYENN